VKLDVFVRQLTPVRLGSKNRRSRRQLVAFGATAWHLQRASMCMAADSICCTTKTNTFTTPG